MANIKIVKRPPSAAVQFANIQNEIAKQLEVVGKQHVIEQEKVVSDFNTKIKFEYRIRAVNTSPPTVTLSIVVKNEDESLRDSDWTVGDLWQALDKTGVRSHNIQPKRAKRLAFLTNYEPHTRPIARYGGPGRATGPIRFAGRVDHPGFPPRKFSESIGKRLDQQFKKAVSRGISLGSKKR